MTTETDKAEQASLKPLDFNDPSLSTLDVNARWQHYSKIALERDLTTDEVKEAIQCTRLLRRTNTGPAKAKSPRKPKATLAVTNLLD